MRFVVLLFGFVLTLAAAQSPDWQTGTVAESKPLRKTRYATSDDGGPSGSAVLHYYQYRIEAPTQIFTARMRAEKDRFRSVSPVRFFVEKDKLYAIDAKGKQRKMKVLTVEDR
jgi:hypothetical protein